MRRISARRSSGVTASNAHVLRLAPPVSARRFSTAASTPSAVETTGASSGDNSAAMVISYRT